MLLLSRYGVKIENANFLTFYSSNSDLASLQVLPRHLEYKR